MLSKRMIGFGNSHAPTSRLVSVRRGASAAAQACQHDDIVAICPDRLDINGGIAQRVFGIGFPDFNSFLPRRISQTTRAFNPKIAFAVCFQLRAANAAAVFGIGQVGRTKVA